MINPVSTLTERVNIVNTPRFWRMVEYRLAGYRHTWRGSVVTSFANPLLFLLAMGFGLGSLVDDGAGSGTLGTDYVSFLAPGLLATTAMQVAVNEASYPILGSVTWYPVGFAQVATPLRPADIALGHLTWIGLRLTMAAAAFALVTVVLGAAESVWIVAAVPAAVLCGLAFAAPMAAFSVTRRRDHALPAVERFVIVPLFLFSGTFFPVSQLPGPLEAVAVVTPLWHGVRLCRTLSLGEATLVGSLGHVAALVAYLAVGVAVALWAFRRRLTP